MAEENRKHIKHGDMPPHQFTVAKTDEQRSKTVGLDLSRFKDMFSGKKGVTGFAIMQIIGNGLLAWTGDIDGVIERTRTGIGNVGRNTALLATKESKWLNKKLLKNPARRQATESAFMGIASLSNMSQAMAFMNPNGTMIESAAAATVTTAYAMLTALPFVTRPVRKKTRQLTRNMIHHKQDFDSLLENEPLTSETLEKLEAHVSEIDRNHKKTKWRDKFITGGFMGEKAAGWMIMARAALQTIDGVVGMFNGDSTGPLRTLAGAIFIIGAFKLTQKKGIDVNAHNERRSIRQDFKDNLADDAHQKIDAIRALFKENGEALCAEKKYSAFIPANVAPPMRIG